MKEIKGTPTILIADIGCKLTQADTNIDLLDRVVIPQVYLAANDSALRWKEISDSEAKNIFEEQFSALNKVGLL